MTRLDKSLQPDVPQGQQDTGVLVDAFGQVPSGVEATVELTEAEQLAFAQVGQQKLEAFTAIRGLHEASQQYSKSSSGASAGSPPAESVAPPPLDLAKTPSLGRFEIREHLGSGGAGLVFRAFDPQLKREVALKVPRPDVVFSEDSAQRFFREAQLAAALQHTNIVPVYEAGEVGVVRYIASAYCSGPSLAEWLRERAAQREPVSPLLAARWVTLLADAVQYAHNRGIIHRDLKPSNILLEPVRQSSTRARRTEQDFTAYSPQISDFGIGKMLEGDAAMTASGAILGTPQYMAPEQAAGLEAGPAADIYGLGVILYELLSGRPPFQGTATLEVLNQVRRDDPIAPRLLNAAVPDDLQTICLKCLEKPPGRRYASAQDVAEDLPRYLEDRPIIARKTNVARRVLKWARRRPTSAALAVVLTLFALAASLGGWWHSVQLGIALDESIELRAESEAQRQNLEQSRRLLEVQERSLRRMIAPTKIQLAHQLAKIGDVPRGSALLSDVASEGEDKQLSRDFAWRYVWGMCHGAEWLCDGGQGEVYYVAFTPDGKTLAVGGQDGTVKLWDPETGREQETLRGHTSCVNGVVYRPDGRQFLTVSCDKSVRLWDAASLEEKATVVAGSAAFFVAAYSPDGKLFAIGEDSGIVSLWDADTLKQVASTQLKPAGHVNGLVFAGSNHRLWCCAGRNAQVYALDNRGALVDTVVPSVTGPVFAVAASPDGRIVAHGTHLGSIKLRDAVTMDEIGQLPTPASDTYAIAFSPDGKLLASGGMDGIVSLWDVATRKVLTSFTGHDKRVSTLAFSPDGLRLASGGFDGKARIWKLDRQVGRRTLYMPGSITKLAFTPDGRHVIGQHGQSVVVWDAQSWIEKTRIEGRFFSVGAAGASGGADHKQESCIAVAQEKQVEIWSLPDARRLAVIDGGGETISSLAVASDAPVLVAAAGNGKTAVYDLEFAPPAAATGPGITPPAGRAVTVRTRAWVPRQIPHTTDLVISPDGSRAAAVVNKANGFYFWDLSRSSKTVELDGLSRAVLPPDVAILTDATGVEAHRNRITNLAFSSDGNLIASCACDNTVRVWNTAMKKEQIMLLGCTAPPSAIAFSPDSRTLAAGGFDHMVRVWDIATGQELLMLDNHTSYVTCVAFSPDGRMLVSGSPGSDGQLEIISWFAPDVPRAPNARGVAAKSTAP